MIKIIFNTFLRMHPLIKAVIFSNLFLIGIAGSIEAVVIIVLFFFIVLFFNPNEQGINSNPFFPLIICSIALVIVIPGGTKHDIEFTLHLVLRILAFSYISIFMGYILLQRDFYILTDILGIKSKRRILFIIMPIFLPTAINAIQNVLVAQRSRGLKLSFKNMFKSQTLEALTIPYIVTILKRALELWITINLRPWNSYIIQRGKIRPLDLLCTTICLALWIFSF